MKTEPESEPENPFPPGTVAASRWESEQERRKLHERTLALLTGDLAPQDQKDTDYLRDMGGVRGKRAGWPKKWTTCARCHAEWQATGFPAPKRSPYQFAFEKNRLGAWLWPGICEKCDEELHAIKAPSNDKPRPKKRRIYVD